MLRLASVVFAIGMLVPAVFAQELIEPSLRVMSFNIRYNNPNDGANAWPKRVSLVESVIRYHEADIIGLQEALPEQIEDLTKMLPDFDYIGVGREANGRGEFSAIFYRRSRMQVLDEGTFWLSATPDEPSKGWDASLNRIVTWGRFEDLYTGKTFYHFNTHFDHRGQLARKNSSELLIRRIERENMEQDPVLVTGDFNATPEDEPILVLTDPNQPMRLTDGMDASVSAPHGPRGTWTGWETAGDPDRRIDYVFVRHDVTVLRYAHISDSWAGRFPSDHLPVLAEVLLSSPEVLPNAHAHNDYHQPQPLTGALSHGFNSVEVDIWHQGHQLVVTHDHPRGRGSLPTLDQLYLAPLARRVQAYQGRVYPHYQAPFFLMIDCKNWDENTYRALRASLSPYRWMLEGANPALVIFLSGSRNVAEVLNDPDRFMAIDGRPEHLGQNFSSTAMPVISQRYSKVITWRGIGNITDEEKAALRRLVTLTHAEGKKLRLWGSPDNEEVWNLLREVGVDYINTDMQAELRSYLLGQ